jgi:hypothetical protein
MNRKPNASAGKGRKYATSPTSAEFGSPNMVAPGSGASTWARVKTQDHPTSARGGSPAIGDKSKAVQTRRAPPANQAGNSLPPKAGTVRKVQLPPGDAGRRNMDR